MSTTIIVSLGHLQELNLGATIAAFSKLAQAQGKKLDLAKMPKIIAVDEDVRAGDLTPKQFREKVLGILEFTATDKDFDDAWNAMQGNSATLLNQLQKLKKQNQDLNIVLVSKTNPIHIKNVYESIHPELKLDEEKASNQLSLLETPLYVSYQSLRYKETRFDSAFYEEIVAKQGLDPKQTIIILQCTSDSPDPGLKKRDEGKADEVKKWAASQGIRIIDRKPKEKIAEALALQSTRSRVFAVPMTTFGSKLHSGKVYLGSFNNKEDQQDTQMRPNMYPY